MAKAKSKTDKKVAEAFHEVYTNKPSTLGTDQTKAEERAQLTAIALSKARDKGAKVPAKPRKSSKASY
jgi:Family of unknown function (DUF6496)